MPEFLVIAHRGYSARFPENSLQSHAAALEIGADLIETDARLTADGAVLCCHDADLSRLTGHRIEIAKSPADHLRQISASSQPLAFLPEVLALMTLDRARDRRLLVDHKTKDLRLLDAVIRAVVAAEMSQRTVFGLRALDQLVYLGRVLPQARSLALPGDYEDLDGWLAAGADAIRVWENELDLPAIRKLRQANHPIWVTADRRKNSTTVGEISPARIAKLKNLGIQGLLLNDPSLAVETKRAVAP